GHRGDGAYQRPASQPANHPRAGRRQRGLERHGLQQGFPLRINAAERTQPPASLILVPFGNSAKVFDHGFHGWRGLTTDFTDFTDTRNSWHMGTVETRYLKRRKWSAGHSRTCQRMKSAARQAAVTLLLSALPCLVQAHDPGLSTATMQLGADKLEAVLVYSVIDVGGLAGLEPVRNGPASKEALARAAAELQQKARDALEVRFDDQP